MGDQNTIIDEPELRHILRRTGFGPSAKDMRKAADLIGASRGAAADYVLGHKRKIVRAKGREVINVVNKWVKHMLKGKNPLLDKTVLFWHDHFSVRSNVVSWATTMEDYLQMLYGNALGNFKDFVKAVNKNAAMQVFLSTRANTKVMPNENYARELCELFTLGVRDCNGVENCAQADIEQIARAFTGWGTEFRPGSHDYVAEFPERGPKILFDNAHGFPPGGASFTTAGEGENEIDEVIDIIFDHRDSDGESTVARRTCFRLLEFFAYANPAKADVDAILSMSGFATNWNLGTLIRKIIVHDVFYETLAAAPFTVDTKKSVKWPVDLVVGTLRMLRMKPRGSHLFVPGGTYLPLFVHMDGMGQTLLDPPSVFGWNWEEGWVSSVTLLARYAFVRDIVAARGRFKPERLVDKDLTDPGEIADAIIAVFGLQGQFGTDERTEIVEYLTDNGVSPVLDLNDTDTRELKLHGAFALVMQSATFQLH